MVDGRSWSVEQDPRAGGLRSWRGATRSRSLDYGSQVVDRVMEHEWLQQSLVSCVDCCTRIGG